MNGNGKLDIIRQPGSIAPNQGGFFLYGNQYSGGTLDSNSFQGPVKLSVMFLRSLDVADLGGDG